MFTCKGVVIGYNSPLWKHKKKEEKTRKTICSLNSEKQWKYFFLIIKKVVFENTKNTKNKNTPPFPRQVFCIFYFQEQKTVFENMNQTEPKTLFKNCLFLIIFTQKIKFDGFTTEAIFFENLFRKLFASNTR